MIWENGIETCIISYKKRIVSVGSKQDTGCLGLVHCDDPEGSYGKGGGRGVQDEEHMCMLMYGKTNTYCKVKQNKTKQKNFAHFISCKVKENMDPVFEEFIN